MAWYSTAWATLKAASGMIAHLAREVAKHLWENGKDYPPITTWLPGDGCPAVAKPVAAPGLSKTNSAVTAQAFKKLAAETKANSGRMAAAEAFNVVNIEYARLRTVAFAMDGMVRNAKLHASNLLIHQKSMRNIDGLVADNDVLRRAIKGIVEHLTVNGKNHELRSISVDRRTGGISQLAALDAYDRTRTLLRDEFEILHDASKAQAKDLENFLRLVRKTKIENEDEIYDYVKSTILKNTMGIAQNTQYLLEQMKELPSPERDKEERFIRHETTGEIKFKGDRPVSRVGRPGSGDN
ncbi:MAG: hypothetical protein M0Z99_18985 [Betaproteobacteria bacterium]|nr:hypothetical protein [Betaproteobacteria bacterium]